MIPLKFVFGISVMHIHTHAQKQRGNMYNDSDLFIFGMKIKCIYFSYFYFFLPLILLMLYSNTFENRSLHYISKDHSKVTNTVQSLIASETPKCKRGQL